MTFWKGFVESVFYLIEKKKRGEGGAPLFGSAFCGYFTVRFIRGIFFKPEKPGAANRRKGATSLERGHASPLLLFVARNGSPCHVHKGHVEFYLRQWAKKGDEVVSPLDSFHLSFPASRFPSHGSARPRANLRATISVPFHLSFLFHLSPSLAVPFLFL